MIAFPVFEVTNKSGFLLHMTTPPLPSTVGIGIATKDRWEDLAETLENLRGFGWDHLPTIVIDDGSREPMPQEFKERFGWITFERFETSRGYIAQRNHLARTLKTDFYLSLDDDSFPVAGRLEDAVRWLQQHSEVAAIGFKIISDGEDVPIPSAEPNVVATRDFIGCGFLLRRDLFLALGGFEERFGYACEEMEYCLRTFGLNYETYGYRGLVVRHRVSMRARPQQLRAYQMRRNHILASLWLYPLPFAMTWGLWGLIKAFRRENGFLTDRLNLFRAAVAGWILYFRWMGQKKRLSYTQFRTWRNKPFLAAV